MKQSRFELLLLGCSKRSQIPSQVSFLIWRYYTNLFTLSMNMYIAFNYTSSVHDLVLLHAHRQDKKRYKSYIYNNSVAHNDGATCIINQSRLPLDIEQRCCLDGMNELNEAQVTSPHWSMVANIGARCEISAFCPSALLGTYGVYKFSLPPCPCSSSSHTQQPTAVTFAHSTQVLYATNAYCELDAFQLNSHKIYAFDFKV